MRRPIRRPIPMLVVILALQLGLAAVLAERRNPLAATTPQTALISTSLQHVDHIVIEGQPAAGAAADSARVELARQKDGQWIVSSYYNAPADKFRLSSVLDELIGLKRGLPIATSSEALERFKLEEGDFERRVTLREGDKALSTVYFGSSAGVRQTDARTAHDHAVYDVQLATYELPTNPSDWLDQDILQRDPDSLSEVDIDGTSAAGATGAALKLVRQSAPVPAAGAPPATRATPATPASRATPAAPVALAAPVASARKTQQVWVDADLPRGRQIDTARADTLARDIAELHVEGILGLTPLPAWQTQHPALTLRIRDDKQAGELATWTLYQPVPPASATPRAEPVHGASTVHGAGAAPPRAAPVAADYYVLKDSAHPWYFRVSSVTGKQLLDDSSAQQLLGRTGQPDGHSAHRR